MLEIFVDGACSGNPGPGGFGIIVVEDGKVIDAFSHFEPDTTNNRMEMSAILNVFFHYGKKGFPKELATVYTDSAYALNTFTNWCFSWAENNWLKADKKVPENLDLVKAYHSFYMKGYRINLVKVKGHSGIKFNEYADKLATGKMTPEQVKEANNE